MAVAVWLLTLATAVRAAEVPFAAEAVISGSPQSPRSVFAADIDGDGDLDAVSGDRLDNRIRWHRNDGGSWTTATIDSNADAARSVFAADIDRDGDVDVLSASSGDNTIAWYENTAGNGTTWTARNIGTDAGGAQAVSAADVDGDGDIDVLAAAHDDDTIAWYENDGTPRGVPWERSLISADVAGAYAVSAADIDDDGDIDVLSASFTDDKVIWHENTAGNGTAWTGRDLATGIAGASSAAAADIDHDGDLDVVSAGFNEEEIAWHENDGTPRGVPWEAHRVAVAMNAGTQLVLALDVDRDGDVDVMSAESALNRVRWHENSAGDGSDWESRVVTDSTHFATSVFAADLDGDGDVDALSGGDDDVLWHENLTIHRSAVFLPESVITSNRDAADSVFPTDLDGDGDLDVLVASFGDDTVSWYQNDGTPADGGWLFRLITSSADGARSVFATDVDSDGDVDVLAASQNDDEITWYENDGTPANGGWTFHTILDSAAGAQAVFAADLDGDGDTDVLSASSEDDTVRWHENDGSPGIGGWTIRTVATVAGASSIFAADIDGDGHIDVVSASPGDDSVIWHRNNGATPPGFGFSPITFFTSEGVQSVFAADVDADGDLDVLSASPDDGRTVWYENTAGDGTSWDDHLIATAATTPGVVSVFVADLDNDGDSDVLTASTGDDAITRFLNDGSPADGGWAVSSITTSADFAAAVSAADLDNDGDLDVLSASSFDDTVAWYENRGGQFELATTDTAPASLVQGQTDDLLRIIARHRGRAGDADLELTAMELLFEASPGDPLSNDEANALIEGLYLYLDDGSGTFTPVTDTQVRSINTLALADGKQMVTLVDGTVSARVSFGGSKTFFIAVQLTTDAASQMPHEFRVTHLTASTSTAEDRDHDIPLTLEYAADVSSKIVSAIALPSPTPTRTRTPTHSRTPTRTPTAPRTATWTSTPVPTSTRMASVTVSTTATMAPTASVTPTDTAPSAPTVTRTTSATPVMTSTNTPVESTPIPQQTRSASSTATPIATATPPPIVTATATGTVRTVGPTFTATHTPFATSVATSTPTPTATPGDCTGDCDGGGLVTINELVLGVNILLGQSTVDACRAMDRNGNGQVTIEELIAAVRASLRGCG
jgi:hypothetical protein